MLGNGHFDDMTMTWNRKEKNNHWLCIKCNCYSISFISCCRVRFGGWHFGVPGTPWVPKNGVPWRQYGVPNLRLIIPVIFKMFWVNGQITLLNILIFVSTVSCFITTVNASNSISCCRSCSFTKCHQMYFKTMIFHQTIIDKFDLISRIFLTFWYYWLYIL